MSFPSCACLRLSAARFGTFRRGGGHEALPSTDISMTYAMPANSAMPGTLRVQRRHFDFDAASVNGPGAFKETVIWPLPRRLPGSAHRYTRGAISMNTLIIGNQPVAQRRADTVRAWKTGKREAAARLDFESLEGAWKLLNTKRWGILRAMARQGPLAIREIARRVGRDVRAVHSDVRALHLSGVIVR
jgi:predicted transcriptional regulator